MRLLQNRAVRIELAVTVLLLLICTAVCSLFSLQAALTVLLFGILLTAARLCFAGVHYGRLARLNADFEQLLRRSDHLNLPDYEEGELSVLVNHVRKTALKMHEQYEALAQDHSYLRESLENVSHQLRTPLTSMTLLLRLLAKPELTEHQRREYLQEFAGLLSRMQYQIEMLLKLSTIEAGAAVFAKETVLCADLIRNAADTVAVSAELKNIRILTELKGEPAFTGDFNHCAEALTNLLKNSIEHTPEGGQIAVSAEQDSLGCLITVTDDGEGIPEEDLPHLFERFYRGRHSSKTGFGIGLAYARQVFEKQNGLLDAVSLKPNGAQFRIRVYASVV